MHHFSRHGAAWFTACQGQEFVGSTTEGRNFGVDHPALWITRRCGPPGAVDHPAVQITPQCGSLGGPGSLRGLELTKAGTPGAWIPRGRILKTRIPGVNSLATRHISVGLPVDPGWFSFRVELAWASALSRLKSSAFHAAGPLTCSDRRPHHLRRAAQRRTPEPSRVRAGQTALLAPPPQRACDRTFAPGNQLRCRRSHQHLIIQRLGALDTPCFIRAQGTSGVPGSLITTEASKGCGCVRGGRASKVSAVSTPMP